MRWNLWGEPACDHERFEHLSERREEARRERHECDGKLYQVWCDATAGAGGHGVEPPACRAGGPAIATEHLGTSFDPVR